MATKAPGGKKGKFSVRVEGLERAAKIPDWLESGQRKTLERAGEKIRDDVAAAAPGGASGSVGRATRIRSLSSTRLELIVDHPGARALARGAYMRSKRGKGTAIRFQAGGTRFVRAPYGTRIKGTDYDKKGLRKRRARMQSAFDEVFIDLERSVG